MEQLELLAEHLGIGDGVTEVAVVDAREISVPLLVDPGRARAAAAVDDHLDAAGDELVVAGRFVGTSRGPNLGDEAPRVVHGAAGAPQREDPHAHLAAALHGAVGVPLLAENARVLHGRHAFAADLAHDPS